MSNTDASFMWETEALRDSARSRTVSSPSSGEAPTPETPVHTDPSTTGNAEAGYEWATLRAAHEQTGIPVETLRKWARRGSVPSYIDDSVRGTLRMIRMDSVRLRATELGREIAPIVIDQPHDVMIDLTEAAPEATGEDAAPESTENSDPAADSESPESPASTRDAAPTEGSGEGTMIVPIAAWDKMLMQLGNLHEAGQQLADARERAAKAETENKFLRERLADLRAEAETDDVAATSPIHGQAPEVSHQADAPSPGGVDGTDTRADSAQQDPASRSRRFLRSIGRWRVELRRR